MLSYDRELERQLDLPLLQTLQSGAKCQRHRKSGRQHHQQQPRRDETRRDAAQSNQQLTMHKKRKNPPKSSALHFAHVHYFRPIANSPSVGMYIFNPQSDPASIC
mmetsp:Transcript_34826/g.52435  ORF Transcript_34826/g.52435 Transcript_34826/m.52435 type:complete len:105 (+) Transcript_34826:159-473(+)